MTLKAIEGPGADGARKHLRAGSVLLAKARRDEAGFDDRDACHGMPDR
jgi:hypothetical protein